MNLPVLKTPWNIRDERLHGRNNDRIDIYETIYCPQKALLASVGVLLNVKLEMRTYINWPRVLANTMTKPNAGFPNTKKGAPDKRFSANHYLTTSGCIDKRCTKTNTKNAAIRSSFFAANTVQRMNVGD